MSKSRNDVNRVESPERRERRLSAAAFASRPEPKRAPAFWDLPGRWTMYESGANDATHESVEGDMDALGALFDEVEPDPIRQKHIFKRDRKWR